MTNTTDKLLPSLEAYLDRIGISEAKAPSAAFLDELIDAHQRTVPFEDLEIYEQHITPSLEVADLFDKMVSRKRGGYCFELNALFNALLLDLGFQSRACMGRVLFNADPHLLIRHRANIVTIDGSDYLADVGFGGPMPTFAPLMEDGATRTEHNQTFTMHVFDELWWEVGYRGSKPEEARVLRICTMPVSEADFIPLSFYQAQEPRSAFRKNRIVNIKTEYGACDLRNMTLTEHRAGQKTAVELEDEQAVDRVLRERFGIVR